MVYKHVLLFAVNLVVLVAVACVPQLSSRTPIASTPNPASEFCEQNSGRLESRQSDSGAIAGICVFPDGSECDEWRYFRSTCKPGDSLQIPEQTSTLSDSHSSSDNWETWYVKEVGLSFQYPADASVFPNDDPLTGLSITGPLVGNDFWPMIFISYPMDREEYRPPEGVELSKWLIDNNLMTGQRMQDIQIAGTFAIRTRQSSSPQSYALDSFYFLNSGQLYLIVIQHNGEMEDWTLYTRFLDSIQFER